MSQSYTLLSAYLLAHKKILGEYISFYYVIKNLRDGSHLKYPCAGDVPDVWGGDNACRSCGVTPSSELNRLYICLSLPAILQE